MATIDLDTKRHVDPEVVLDIGSQLPPVKRNATTPAPDYGDYEDYELTARPETSTPRRVEPHVLDSQFKPHVKVTMNQKSSAEVRDEVARLMGDLHREELTLRTTVTPASASPMEMMLLGNETMFFSDEEGSGEMVQDQLLNTTAATTTKRPLLFTTLIQEVKTVEVTARPDQFAHLDYDLSDYSDLKKLPKPSRKVIERPLKRKLHGGAVGTVQKQTLTKSNKPNRNPKPLLIRAGKPIRRKTLKKMKKIERMRRVKNLNHRVRAQNRMRLRKVLSKMIFGPRDSDVQKKSTKLKFVGSDGLVTPRPRKKVQKPPTEFFHQRNRDKRSISEEDTVPIEKSIIESIHFEPHPYYHLREDGKTQVEPSLLVNEDAEERPMREGLVQVALGKPLRLVTLKKVSKKEKSADGVALVAPSAHKPTMLELLIGDFLQRLPPTARSPYLTDEQWS
uniref:Uncharacterized protein n=1 Tax=Caenorhabditis tropicalis TaxID=1561998 RepID=A0A1I7TA69_9PELO